MTTKTALGAAARRVRVGTSSSQPGCRWSLRYLAELGGHSPQGHFKPRWSTHGKIYTMTPLMFVSALVQFNSSNSTLGTQPAAAVGVSAWQRAVRRLQRRARHAVATPLPRARRRARRRQGEPAGPFFGPGAVPRGLPRALARAPLAPARLLGERRRLARRAVAAWRVGLPHARPPLAPARFHFR